MDAANVLAAMRTRMKQTLPGDYTNAASAVPSSATRTAPLTLDSNPLMARAIESRAGDEGIRRRAI